MTSAVRDHRVHRVHRFGAAALGVVLWIFAAIGFAGAPQLFGEQGATALGMSTSGALSAISVLAGAVLVGTAWRGDPTASTAAALLGVLFTASGLAHLAVLGTGWNLLGFRMPNVVFSLSVGIALGVLGTYGRIAGGLPPDNPFRRARPLRRARPSPEQQTGAGHGGSREQELVDAELAMGEGHPTPRQEALVKEQLAEHQRREHLRAWQRSGRDERGERA
ncbi:DUF4383 domain-containing protein [Saccharopolyspora sp. HNM0983]|uniref:DUF4383 domain-containing protein n=1 Tax=Saccharopolyspora montiporae TaxID=2781240 RepID=A0A929B5Q1_9PSEU|nr:DUF4383 domain-containing protein [Saccharopolyspora sp. HNM0983]MBE9373639.1 DUF4383 domain-containing protein [Saccharopolyspora sp. HNM0983]